MFRSRGDAAAASDCVCSRARRIARLAAGAKLMSGDLALGQGLTKEWVCALLAGTKMGRAAADGELMRVKTTESRAFYYMY